MIGECEICQVCPAEIEKCDWCGALGCGQCVSLVEFTGDEQRGDAMLCCHCLDVHEQQVTDRINAVKAADMGAELP